VLELMRRVRIIPSHRHTLFGPTVTIYLKDGRAFTKEGSGREFIWDFEGLRQRIAGVRPGLPIAGEQYDELTAACSAIESLERASRLIELTVIPALDVS
jgi:hypothetical protein